MNNISTATIEPMLKIIERFNNGYDVRDDLEQLLEHDDYKIEIERYQNKSNGGGFTKEEFIDFFINIRSLCEDDIHIRSLQQRKKGLLYIMDNVYHYKNVYENIKSIDNKYIDEALKITHYGLPEDIRIDNMNFIFSIGLGMSGGWIYENYSQYDLKEVLDTGSALNIKNTLAHECHHMGMNVLTSTIDEEKLATNLDSFLMLLLSGEGTAIKYCNNFEGKLTKKLKEGENVDCIKQSYEYYMNNFIKIYDVLRKDISDIRSGKYSGLGEIQQLFMKNYFYTDVEIEGVVQQNYLLQPITYFLGADIWGIIHDNLGKDAVFRSIKNPDTFFKTYNIALEKSGKNEYKL